MKVTQGFNLKEDASSIIRCAVLWIAEEQPAVKVGTFMIILLFSASQSRSDVDLSITQGSKRKISPHNEIESTTQESFKKKMGNCLLCSHAL